MFLMDLLTLKTFRRKAFNHLEHLRSRFGCAWNR
jgi:hypothetical protein